MSQAVRTPQSYWSLTCDEGPSSLDCETCCGSCWTSRSQTLDGPRKVSKHQSAPAITSVKKPRRRHRKQTKPSALAPLRTSQAADGKQFSDVPPQLLFSICGQSSSSDGQSADRISSRQHSICDIALGTSLDARACLGSTSRTKILTRREMRRTHGLVQQTHLASRTLFLLHKTLWEPSDRKFSRKGDGAAFVS